MGENCNINQLTIRGARLPDLDSINAIVEACVLTWDLPERVKRLSMSSYRYDQQDLEHLELVIAELPGQHTVGVAALDAAAKADCPAGSSGMLLHGLYVDPSYFRQGIGQHLLVYTLARTKTLKKDGLLVKAQPGAIGYFQSQGFIPIDDNEQTKSYAHRWWKPV